MNPSAPGRGTYRWVEKTITPGTMITTGANVPRNLWYVRGLSPWAFAQAAIIHDWLLEAHHRHLAGEKGYDSYKDITIKDAADIFAAKVGTRPSKPSLNGPLLGQLRRPQ